MHKINDNKVFLHKDDKAKTFLMGEGTMEPVYDKPSFRKKN